MVNFAGHCSAVITSGKVTICIKNDEFCIKNDELRIKKMMNFALKMMNCVFKMMFYYSGEASGGKVFDKCMRSAGATCDLGLLAACCLLLAACCLLLAPCSLLLAVLLADCCLLLAPRQVPA